MARKTKRSRHVGKFGLCNNVDLPNIDSNVGTIMFM